MDVEGAPEAEGIAGSKRPASFAVATAKFKEVEGKKARKEVEEARAQRAVEAAEVEAVKRQAALAAGNVSLGGRGRVRKPTAAAEAAAAERAAKKRKKKKG